MCVDSANCGGNCTERQHDTIKHLRVRIVELEAERDRLLEGITLVMEYDSNLIDSLRRAALKEGK